MAKPVETIDQIVARLQSGSSWSGFTIFYSMTGTTRLDEGGNIIATGADLSDANAIVSMTPTERIYAREAFELWDDLIQPNITENSDRNAGITFNYTSSATHASNGYTQNAAIGSSTLIRSGIWFTNNGEYTNDASFATSSFGSHAQNNYLHEIGHSLGLRHPGAYDSVGGGAITYAGNAEFAQDTEQYTVMSYFRADNYGGADHTNAAGVYIYPQTPMLVDVLAVQRTYGYDISTRTGDTVYGFNSTAGRSVFDFSQNSTPVITIWDANGIDTLNLSGFNGDQVVNLEPGTISSVGNRDGLQPTELTQNVAIAFSAIIENATGGSGNDTIWGNSSANVLDGRGGADTLRGFGGVDVYYVDNVGDNVIEEGSDVGDRVNTTLTSYTLTAGIEILDYQGLSTLTFFGKGNALNNSIFGYGGNDILDGLGGADLMRGYTGNDTYYVDNVNDVADEGGNDPNDRVLTTLTSYTLGPTLEYLQYVGPNTQAFTGNGNASANTIIGLSGNDVLDGKAGADLMRGLSGNDLYYVDNVGDVVEETTTTDIDDRVYTTLTSYTLGANVEFLNYVGNSSLSFTGIGNELANTILGFFGNDILNGKGGADFMRGYSGDDTFIVDNAGDTVEEFADSGTRDTVAALVNYVLPTNAQIEFLNTGNASGTGAQNLTGNGFSQRITGNDGVNALDGGGGGDILEGRGGNDSYVVRHAGDVIIEGAGAGAADTVAALVGYTLTSGAQVEFLNTGNGAGTGAINLTGNAFAQRIDGNDGVNRLDGKGGADTMVGRGGNDVYIVDNAGDIVVEGAGQGALDVVAASVGYALGANVQVEQLQTTDGAGTTAMNLYGNAFAQSIIGNNGANQLAGGLGLDVLTGRGGADIFLFNTALSAGNIDRITDFSVVDDTIRLDDAVFAGLALGALAANAFTFGAAAADAFDRIIYNSGSGALSFDQDGNGAIIAVQFATLATGLNTMSNADFLVV